MSCRYLVLPLLALALCSLLAAPSAADEMFWIPRPDKTTLKDIVYEKHYVSIRMYRVNSYHNDGDVHFTTVASQVKLNPGGRPVEGTLINGTFRGGRGEPYSALVRKHLISTCPASFRNLNVRVMLRGFSENRDQQRFFDLLATEDVGTLLNLSAPALSIFTAVTNIAQEVLAPRYTQDYPKDLLDADLDFRIPAEGSGSRSGALREGYLVVIGARERGLPDLAELRTGAPNNWRVTNGVLQYRDSEGKWENADRFCYVILEVSASECRGEETSSPWRGKFDEARAKVQDALEEVQFSPGKREGLEESVGKEIPKIVAAGRILLAADPAYIEGERNSIYARNWTDITTLFYRLRSSEPIRSWNVAIEAIADLPTSDLPLAVEGSPREMLAMALEYEWLLERQQGSLALTLTTTDGVPISDVEMTLRRSRSAEWEGTGVTDEAGQLVVGDLPPDRYAVSYVDPVTERPATQIITIDPCEDAAIMLVSKD